MAIATLAERGELSRAARTFLRTEAGSAVLLLAATVSPCCGRTRRAATRRSGTPSWPDVRQRRLRARPAALGQRRAHGALLPQHRPGDLAGDALGELRGVRLIVAPASAALGGLPCPPVSTWLLNAGGPGAGGLGGADLHRHRGAARGARPVGPRCPDPLRVFLLALAIVDDMARCSRSRSSTPTRSTSSRWWSRSALFAALVTLRLLHFWRTARVRRDRRRHVAGRAGVAACTRAGRRRDGPAGLRVRAAATTKSLAWR